MQVNTINEELAKTILALDDKTVTQLTEYLQLQLVPDEFQIAKKANLFFMLNYVHFKYVQILLLIGIDVCVYIMNVLYEGFKDEKYKVCPLLEKMVSKNQLGKKTKEGFYKYEF